MEETEEKKLVIFDKVFKDAVNGEGVVLFGDTYHTSDKGVYYDIIFHSRQGINPYILESPTSLVIPVLREMKDRDEIIEAVYQSYTRNNKLHLFAVKTDPLDFYMINEHQSAKKIEKVEEYHTTPERKFRNFIIKKDGNRGKVIIRRVMEKRRLIDRL